MRNARGSMLPSIVTGCKLQLRRIMSQLLFYENLKIHIMVIIVIFQSTLSFVIVVNAFYQPKTNRMSFPAAFLQNNMFNSRLPLFVNYGGVGAIVGHEITHGFDDNGRKFDYTGQSVVERLCFCAEQSALLCIWYCSLVDQHVCTYTATIIGIGHLFL